MNGNAVAVIEDAQVTNGSPRPVAPAAPSMAMALLATPRPELAKALARAVQACAAVAPDRRNEYHKYDYTSSEAIIAEGRSALSKCGLSLLPVESSLQGWEREGADRFELVRTFLLLHESGESAPLRVVWPVVPDKGRPLDKATAAADTLSLAYLLRDLLMMARVEQTDDVGGREDRQAAPPQKQASQKTAPAQPASKMPPLEKQVAAREKVMVDLHLMKPGEMAAALSGHFKKPLSEMAGAEDVTTTLNAVASIMRQALMDAVIKGLKATEHGWEDAGTLLDLADGSVTQGNITVDQLAKLLVVLRDEAKAGKKATKAAAGA